MAGGVNDSLRPQPPSSAAGAKLLLLLTLLPLALAPFAFVLQWRGGISDPSVRWSSADSATPGSGIFPGMDDSLHTAAAGGGGGQSPGCVLLPAPSSHLFPYFRELRFNHESDLNLSPKICITTSTSAGLEQILPWTLYHKVIGVTTFFLFVEGKAASPNVSNVLKSIPGVQVIHRTRELEEQQAKSRTWNESWLSNFFYKPCNNELFVKQSLNMEMAIVMGRDAGMDWIIHLDTDELIYPAGAQEYSLRELLFKVPGEVDMVIFPNYESCVERDDIKEPFSEGKGTIVVMVSGMPNAREPRLKVSMFKKNYDHLSKDTYFSLYREATRNNPNYFLTYGNGKSAARIQDHLRSNGAHKWENYMKVPKRITLEEAAVLHYTYSKYSDLTSRRDRCHCKPTKEDVKRCFMLEFDRDAFIIASTATDREMLNWYREHVVWADKSLKIKLLRKGILTRIYEPMVIIQSLKESGVFSSIIESAPTKHSRDKLLQSSTKKTSTSRSAAPGGLVPSGKLPSRSSVSQATARKALGLGMSAAESYDAAIPPLSSPDINKDDSLITEAW